MSSADALAMRVYAATDALLNDTARIGGITRACLVTTRGEILRGFREQGGIRYATEVLPSIGKALDKAIANDGNFELPVGIYPGRRFPLIFEELWTRVFDASGAILDIPDPSAVRLLRQVLYLSYKLELGYTADVIESCIRKHIDTDNQLPMSGETMVLSPRTARVVELARVLVSRVFEGTIRNAETRQRVGFDPSDIVPKHGPGAVADRKVKAHNKYMWRTFYSELDEEFRYSDYFFFNAQHLCDWLHHFLGLPDRPHGFARICAVEKDSRGPRLISMEPLEYQWIQQGLGRAMIWWLEHHPHTRDAIRFTDQSVNRNLALLSSCGGSLYDTLDLKDASDRVSIVLVQMLFPPLLLRKIMAARSKGTRIGRYEHVYRKYAPMGSALCFPVESVVFWALSVAAYHIDTFTWTGQRLRALDTSVVKVYGDDLIVPHGSLERLLPVFNELHLEFNADKCCTGKFFRESCGCDAFAGVDVTPIKMKHLGDAVSDTVAICEYANAARRRGLDMLSEVLFGIVESRIGPLPWSSNPDAVLHRWVDDWVTAQLRTLRHAKVRLNADLQRLEYYHLSVKAPTKERRVPFWAEFFRCFPDQEIGRLISLFYGEKRKELRLKVLPFGRKSHPATPFYYTPTDCLVLTGRWRGFD